MLQKIKKYQEKVVAYLGQFRDVRNIGLLLFLVLLILITWSGVKAIDTNYGLQKHISQLEQQNSVKKLANENLKLKNDYYNTPQYLEVAARQEFGLAAPGETVLIVPRAIAMSLTVDLQPAAKTGTSKAAKKPAWQRNFQAWTDFLLHRAPDQD